MTATYEPQGMLPKGEQIHEAAVRRLIEGNQFLPALLVAECFVQIGEACPVPGQAGLVDLTVHCDESVFGLLQPIYAGTTTDTQDSPELGRIRAALEGSMPVGVGITAFNVKVSKVRITPSDTLAAEIAVKMRAAAFLSFANLENLKSVGRQCIDDFLQLLTKGIDRHAFSFPVNTLPDDQYFTELSHKLCLLERSPAGLREGIGEVIRAEEMRSLERIKESGRQHFRVVLERKDSARALLESLVAVQGIIPEFPTTLSEEQSKLVRPILDILREYADNSGDREPSEDLDFERHLSNQVKQLGALGLVIFSGKCKAKRGHSGGKTHLMPLTVIVVAFINDSRIVRRADGSESILGAIPRDTDHSPGDAIESQDISDFACELRAQMIVIKEMLAVNAQERDRHSSLVRSDKNSSKAVAAFPASAPEYCFRKAGSFWDVTFEGGGVFHIKDTLGADYINYLLHHPKEEIGAFELETIIRPGKGEIRSLDSIQRAADGKALRDFREELCRLESELEQIDDREQPEKATRLKMEIATLKATLDHRRLANGDVGERARDNVRKAIGKVINNLTKDGEKAFANHVDGCIDRGYSLIYNAPDGIVWSVL